MEIVSTPKTNYISSSSYRSEPDHSLEEVNFNDFYPKKSTIFEQEGLKIPFSLVPGEYVVYIGSMNNGIIALSNFRLFVSEHNSLLFNLPLGLIDYIENCSLVSFNIFCKDGKTFKCFFSTSDKCTRWMGWLADLMLSATRLPSCFALTFCAWCLTDKIHLDPSFHRSQSELWLERKNVVFDREVTRMGFNLNSDTKAWRICHANHNYEICDTYPQSHIVPWCISDDMIADMSKYRSHRRFPSVVWRDTETGLVLVRSSQPNVGVFWWRNNSDETFLKSIGRSCRLNPGPRSLNGVSKADVPFEMKGIHNKASDAELTKDLLLVDARSFAAATVNRAKGGGVECDEYYPNVNVVFMSLPNIHAIKKSFNLLRALSSVNVDDSSWWSSLEGSKWFSYMSSLLKSSLVVVDSIKKEGRSVLVHCSDGWDRTPQIISLAQIIMDPHYRTIEGFHDLVEREWLEFGHRFADRCSQGIASQEDYDNKSPIFLQWLDCIHQLLNQFPCTFQFNMNFLVKMVEHCYSCLFGEFLYNSDLERSRHKQPHKSASIWAFLLNNPRFINPLYKRSNKVLRPSCMSRDMRYWTQLYSSQTQHHSSSILIDDLSIQSDVCDDDDVTGCRSSLRLVERKKNGYVEMRNGLTKRHTINGATNGDGCHEDDDGDDSGGGDDGGYINGKKHDCEEDVTGEDKEGEERKSDGLIEGEAHVVNECNDDEETYKDYNGDNEEEEEEEEDVQEDIFNEARSSRRRSLSHDTSHGKRGERNESDKLRRSRKESSSSTGLHRACPITIKNNHLSRKQHHLSSPKILNESFDFSQPFKSEYLSSSSPRVFRVKYHENVSQPEVSREGGMQHMIDTDGLTIHNDQELRGVMRLQRTYESRISKLMKTVEHLRSLVASDATHDLQDCKDDLNSDGSSPASSGGSAVSWEVLSESQDRMVLWVPDHHVTHCTSCHREFWIALRKHHCRSCGKIFCNDCTNHCIPCPEQDLNLPVRVCKSCFNAVKTTPNKCSF